MSLPLPAIWTPPQTPPRTPAPVLARHAPLSGPGHPRRSTRVPVRAPLSWRLDGVSRAARTGDVSRYGLSVISEEVPPIDEIIQVDLNLRGPRAELWFVSAMARVRWSRDNPILAPPSTLFGVQIIAYRDASHAAAYETFVESLLRTVIVMEV